jgi:hypothetical protein
VRRLALVLLLGCGGGQDDGAVPDAGIDAGLGPPIDEPYPPGAPAVGWFEDVSASSGLEHVHVAVLDDFLTRSKGTGVAAGDVDGDGRIDLLIGGGAGPAHLYRNLGGLRFVDVSQGAGLDPGVGVLGVGLADLDGDGDLDAVLTGERQVTVLRNRGDGTFDDISPTLTEVGSAVSVHFLDADGDGDTDLYISCYVFDLIGIGGRLDRLLRNLGDGTFADVSDRLAQRDGFGWAAASLDHDGDGDLDLYVANDTFVPDTGPGPPPSSNAENPRPDYLWRNDGNLVFTEVGATAGIDEFRSSMGIISADFTGDGLVDVYVSDYGQNDLFAGNGAGGFVDRTAEYGVGATWRRDRDCPPEKTTEDCLLSSWGSGYEDLDLDGDRDLLVINGAIVTGDLASDPRQPAAVWRADAAGFTPVQAGLGWIGGRGLALADLDDDGDLDLVVASWDGPPRLFRNLADASGGWLRVRLRGTVSNPDGLGARITAHLAGGGELVRDLGFGGVVHSGVALEAHFGLGAATVDRLEIRFPSGTVVELAQPEIDRRLVVTEPAAPTPPS